jgi:CRP-like cAMP-binding protein
MITDRRDSNETENLRPCLSGGVETIPFGRGITFLRNPSTGATLKLTAEEAVIAGEFTGHATLADILQRQLESKGTSRFQAVFDLLDTLSRGGFLGGNFGARAMSEDRGPAKPGVVTVAAAALKKWTAFTLLNLPLAFRNNLLQKAAAWLVSPAMLIACVAVSCAAAALLPDFEGLNIFQGFMLRPDASAVFKYGSYAVSLAIVWCVFCAVLSIKNLISAYVLAAHGCNVGRPRISFYYGLVFFNADLDDILKAGPRTAVRFFGGRIVCQFVLLFLALALWHFFPALTALLLAAQACLITAFFSLSPLINSDLSRMLYLVVPQAGRAKGAVTFLTRRFLIELCNFRKTSALYNYHILISVLCIVWIYIFYSQLWSVIRGGALFLLADLATGSTTGKLLICAYLLIIAVPPAFLVILSAAIALSNLRSSARLPIHRLKKLAAGIGTRKVAGHERIIQFLGQIPLFSRLDTAELKDLCSRLSLLRFGRNHEVILQGEPGDAFYIIVEGELEVVAEERSGTECRVVTLTTGDSFGEIALIENVPRTATVRTITPAVLFRLDKKDFGRLLAVSGESGRKITDMLRISRLIFSIGIFSYLNPRQVNRLVRLLAHERFDTDTVLFEQGDPGDKFYIIYEGSVRIERKDNGAITMEKNLVNGDYFGEIALIKNIPRTARAAAIAGTHLLSLGKQDF